jgi:hypothetical protein
VFFHEAAAGGRVFFDHLGPPWPKHACTNRPNWKWRKIVLGGPFSGRRPTPEEVRAVVARPVDWLPVVEFRREEGRPACSFLMDLAGGTVWHDGAELGTAVLWFADATFDWDGPVFMRPRPHDPTILEFETYRVARGASRAVQLIAIRDDAEAAGAVLAERLRRAQR